MLTEFSHFASISVWAELTGCLLAFRKLLARPARRTSAWGRGPAAGHPKQKPGGVRSNFRHAVPKRGYLGNCSATRYTGTQRERQEDGQVSQRRP
jgi:hypothetical protein